MVVKVELNSARSDREVFITPKMQQLFDILETTFPNVEFTARVQPFLTSSIDSLCDFFHVEPHERVKAEPKKSSKISYRENPSLLEVRISLPPGQYQPTLSDELTESLDIRLTHDTVETCLYLLPTHVEFVEKFRELVPDIKAKDIFDLTNEDDSVFRTKLNRVLEQYYRTCLPSEIPSGVKVLSRIEIPKSCTGVSFTLSNSDITRLTPELLTVLADLLKV